MAVVEAGTNDGASRAKVRLEMYEESNSISSNTSVIRIRVNVIDNNASYGGYGTGSWSASIPALGLSWGYSFSYDFSAGQNYALLDTAFTLNHAGDGSASIVGNASFSGESPVGSASTSLTLSSPSTITDFDYTAGIPATLTAQYIAGTGVKLDWAQSVSYKTPVTYYVSRRQSSDGGATYGAWSSETSTTNLTYTYTGLTPGLTYQFRVRAYNGYDNYSGYRTSNTVFLTAGGKRFSSPNWVLTASQAKRWNGSAWVSLTIAKRFDAATNTWVNLS